MSVHVIDTHVEPSLLEVNGMRKPCKEAPGFRPAPREMASDDTASTICQVFPVGFGAPLRPAAPAKLHASAGYVGEGPDAPGYQGDR